MSKNNTMVNKAKEKSCVNPLVKMMQDKLTIMNAIKNGKDLSTLKGIKIVSPI
ncbi:hypothetical protein [Pedobacter cryophilus]|uniref:hypothetical protein n=1 Tax=Pedobacter cryophilus TaxID=2571271 RepID=UPI00145E4750|nr:hypothetical protein [Pedobacter cryophilus]